MAKNKISYVISYDLKSGSVGIDLWSQKIRIFSGLEIDALIKNIIIFRIQFLNRKSYFSELKASVLQQMQSKPDSLLVRLVDAKPKSLRSSSRLHGVKSERVFGLRHQQFFQESYFCPTSKVSRDHTWREACVSTIRDMYGRWLYCLVRLLIRFHLCLISIVKLLGFPQVIPSFLKPYFQKATFSLFFCFYCCGQQKDNKQAERSKKKAESQTQYSFALPASEIGSQSD